MCHISPDMGGNPTPKDASEVRHLQLLAGSSSKLTTNSLKCHLLATSTLTVAERHFPETHWYYSLQADVEVLFLIGFEFFQGNSSFSNKLIVAKFVFITHRDPEGKRKGEHQPGWSRNGLWSTKPLLQGHCSGVDKAKHHQSLHPSGFSSDQKQLENQTSVLPEKSTFLICALRWGKKSKGGSFL